MSDQFHSTRLLAASALLTVSMTLAAPDARADPAYRAADIVSHFARRQLGEARSVCIGSETECAKSAPTSPAAPPSGFDLVVNFQYNSDALTRQARGNLDEFAKALKDPRLGGEAFVVEGHTDGMGSDEFNLDLSIRRARAVVSYLETHGVSAEKLEAKGYGKQKLLVPDPMDKANRRVETRLKDGG